MFALIKSNKLILVVIIVILVGGVWYGMTDSGPEALLTSQAVTESETEQALVDELLQLRSIRLDGAIFSDPAFASLKDSGVDIVSEPVGKRNPFAPLAGVSSPIRTVPSTASTTPRSRPGGGEQ